MVCWRRNPSTQASTGTRPSTAIQRILFTRPVVDSALPAALAQILSACLADDPSDRLPSAAELADRLAGAGDGPVIIGADRGHRRIGHCDPVRRDRGVGGCWRFVRLDQLPQLSPPATSAHHRAAGVQIADHIASVLEARDPEPLVGFAVIGLSDHGWASLLHGPVQVWDGARWLYSPSSPGWFQAIITPRPAITVGASNAHNSRWPNPTPCGTSKRAWCPAPVSC